MPMLRKKAILPINEIDKDIDLEID